MNRTLGLLLFLVLVIGTASAQELQVYDINLPGAGVRRLYADMGDHCAFRIPSLTRKPVRLRMFAALNNGDYVLSNLGKVVGQGCDGYYSTVVYPTAHADGRFDFNFYFSQEWLDMRLVFVFESYEGAPQAPWREELVRFPAGQPAREQYFAHRVEVIIRRPADLAQAKVERKAVSGMACHRVIELPGTHAVERLWRARLDVPETQSMASFTRR
ncbi:MAG TPA: hypothetical protein VNA69_11340 [Thermoanaerobaculia bacterium]|nr:hypothetical protein [Thermoanaerobaculia bacterium]